MGILLLSSHCLDSKVHDFYLFILIQFHYSILNILKLFGLSSLIFTKMPSGCEVDD